MKANVLEYSKHSVVVTIEEEEKFVKNYGKLVLKPRNAQSPCWVFSPKRKKEAEKLAKENGTKTFVYNPESGSIAVPAAMPYVSKFMEMSAKYNDRLKNGKKRFAGWIFKVSQADQVAEVISKLQTA